MPPSVNAPARAPASKARLWLGLGVAACLAGCVHDAAITDAGITLPAARQSPPVSPAPDDPLPVLGLVAPPPVSLAPHNRPALGPRAAQTSCLNQGAFPPLLSQTGCYADLRTHALTDDLIPYDVAAPLWTDGAAKDRYLSLPPGTRIVISPGGGFDFPVGAVLLKEFRVHDNARDPGSARLIETRAMINTKQGWTFAGYKWNDDGRDATLVEKAHYQPMTVRMPTGATTRIEYLFPASRDCTTCHAQSITQAFGPSALQLDKVLAFDGARKNQVHALGEIGVFQGAPIMPGGAMVDPRDESAPLHLRARSWLHANCSHCHQPGGWSPPGMTMDLRFDQNFRDARICDVITEYLTPLPRISPGDPGGSAIWRRITSPGFDRMPPLGVSVTDPDAEVVRAWIASLADCSRPDGVR